MFVREMAERVHLSEDTLRYYEKSDCWPTFPAMSAGTAYMVAEKSKKSSRSCI